MEWTLTIMISALIGCAYSQMSIPSGKLGFVYKDAMPCDKVKLAAYLDLSCPDSKQAFPTLLQVADHFGTQLLELKIHMFPLPYHRNSHLLSKAAYVLDGFKSKTKNSTVYDWFKMVYDNIDKIAPSATTEMTDSQVMDLVAGWATAVSGIPAAELKKGVSDVGIDESTRLAWKYGCTRGVYGTPLFTVNDVFVQAQADWTVAQWISLIKPVTKLN